MLAHQAFKNEIYPDMNIKYLKLAQFETEPIYVSVTDVTSDLLFLFLLYCIDQGS